MIKNCLPIKQTQVQSLIQKIPHDTRHLSPCVTTTEPVLWNPGATTPDTLRVHAIQWEACASQPGFWLCLLATTTEKPVQHSQKLINQLIFFNILIKRNTSRSSCFSTQIAELCKRVNRFIRKKIMNVRSLWFLKQSLAVTFFSSSSSQSIRNWSGMMSHN